jgi:hypothetical protein
MRVLWLVGLLAGCGLEGAPVSQGASDPASATVAAHLRDALETEDPIARGMSLDAARARLADADDAERRAACAPAAELAEEGAPYWNESLARRAVVVLDALPCPELRGSLAEGARGRWAARSGVIRVRALRAVLHAADREAGALARELQDDELDRIRAVSLQYVLAHGTEAERTVTVQRISTDPSPRVRAVASVSGGNDAP